MLRYLDWYEREQLVWGQGWEEGDLEYDHFKMIIGEATDAYRNLDDFSQTELDKDNRETHHFKQRLKLLYDRRSKSRYDMIREVAQ